MTPFEWFAIGSMVLSAIGGLTGTIYSNKKNESLQREAWERQSIASRVNELKESGLNKQLATGMNPNYNVQTSFQSPDLNLGKMADFLGAQSERENIRQATSNATTQGKILDENLTIAQEEAKIKKHDADIITKRPYASTDPQLVRNISGIKDLILGEDGRNINSLNDVIDAGVELVYELGDKKVKRMIDRTIRKDKKVFIDKGGVPKNGSYTSQNVVPVPVDSSKFAHTYHHAKNLSGRYGRN